MGCCSNHPTPEPPKEAASSSCCSANPEATSCGCDSTSSPKVSWFVLLLITGSLSALVFAWLPSSESAFLTKGQHFGNTFLELLWMMLPGLLIGWFALSLLGEVPREIVTSALGTNQGKSGVTGIFRATVGGVVFDLCNHGILMVAAKLYERGATLGQTFAFIIASPWNSLSLTFVLIGLIGWKWTLAFVALSAVIAFITGFIVDQIVPKRQESQVSEERFAEAWKAWWKAQTWPKKRILGALTRGFSEALGLAKWLILGSLLAALLRTFVPAEIFAEYAGPTILGLAITLITATVIEVCSEGSAPLGAELLTQAKAPGNGFAFLMAGVSTDQSEILLLKKMTGTFKLSLLLPAISLPQVIIVAWLLNQA